MNAAQNAERRSLRTPNDVSALCVELLRAVREQEWTARPPARRPAGSLDRAWRAWRADLDRYGPLRLVAGDDGLRAGESGPPVGRGRLEDLAARLRVRGVASVLFEPGLDAPTYSAFVSLLVADPREIESHGGAVSFLPERGVGICLFAPDDAPASEEDKPEAERPHAAHADGAGPEVLHGEGPGPVVSMGPTPLPGEDDDPFDLVPDDGDVPQLEPDELAEPAPGSRDSTREAVVERMRAVAGETTVRMTAEDARARASLPEAPDALGDGEGIDVTAPPGSALAALLDPGDATPYGKRVARAVSEAAAWREMGQSDSCFLTVLALAEQSGERGGLGRAERSAALGGLRELCTGRVLADLVARASASDTDEGRRVSRVLLKLGEPVVAELISAIDAESDPARREELMGIAIALGRASTATLHRAMEGDSPNRARIAARIAGEIREERAVPTLSRLLDHKRAEVRGESARALARIGNVAALTTLKRGLSSEHDDVSSLCAYCLGVTGSSDAAAALTETLRDARRTRRTQLASAVIRSLGRLGREESVPELKRVIDKRAFFRRQELRELKLQAIGALAKVHGERSREVLEAVAQGSDMGLAVAARRALKEMDEASA